MDPFGSKPHVLHSLPPKDRVGASIGSGVGISVSIFFGLTFLAPILGLPAPLAGQVLSVELVIFALLTIFCGAKAGRVMQAATLGVAKALVLGLFALIKLIFSVIAQLLSRKPSNSEHH